MIDDTREGNGRYLRVAIDWPRYDALRGQGLSIAECARQLRIAKGTLIRRAWERKNGTVYHGKEGHKAGSPAGPGPVPERHAPSIRRFSWES